MSAPDRLLFTTDVPQEIADALRAANRAARTVNTTERHLIDQRTTRNERIRTAIAAGAGIRQVARATGLTPRAVTLIDAQREATP